MNKRVKLNYKNILLFITLIVLSFQIILDLITIGTSIAQYTLFGGITTLLTLYAIAKIIEYFEDYSNMKKSIRVSV